MIRFTKIIFSCLLILGISNFMVAQESGELSIEDKRVQNIEDLISRVKSNTYRLNAKDKKAIDDFISYVQQRESMLKDAKFRLAQEEKRSARLEKSFEDNEQVLTELESELQLKLGVLGELFGVARQMAGELKADTIGGFNFSEFPNRDPQLDRLATLKVLDLPALEDLWLLHLNEIKSSGEIINKQVNIIEPNGDISSDTITRYGPFNAALGSDFLTVDLENNGYKKLAKQPEGSITGKLKSHQKSDEYAIAPIDPTRGFLLSLYLEKPTIFQRVAQGKLIGFIILIIGISGFIFAIYRYYFLFMKGRSLASEKQTNSGIYKEIADLSSNSKDADALERSIDEILVALNGSLSKGVNWIKFLAAVAPLLGLLGTVIGMIETFQAITLFGTGDPKQMAGGISQALVTTMLGLIFAAPLLALYTLLSEKVNEIMQDLDEYASLTLAKKS